MASVTARSGTHHEVPTQVKDPALVAKRRRQIVDASVALFVKNGYHNTTTRQIAKATGFSIGSLYEYVSTKEDVLYLVCDAIHAEMEKAVAGVVSGQSPGPDMLRDAVRGYFAVCDAMSDHIVLIYQVTQFLSGKWKKKVLDNEIRVTDSFRQLLENVIAAECVTGIDARQIDLAAHNIAVLGHAWAFRRWFYLKHYSLEEYTEFQIRNILGALAGDIRSSMKKGK
ncbi:MAG: TetR/AcrR family transcriptional regulator [Thermodesulfobacteriota bacterium]